MNIHIPHITPLQTNFTRLREYGIEYTTQDHILRFNLNTITIEGKNNLNLAINTILTNFKVYRGKHFQKLHLHIRRCHGADKSVLQSLGREISTNFRNLTELELFFYKCDITDEGLRYLLGPIGQRLQCLKKLQLRVCCCRAISDKGMSYFKSLILDKVKSLCELCLVFSGEETLYDGHEVLPFEVDIKKCLRYLCSRSGWLESQHPKLLTALLLCQGMKKYQRSLTKLVFVFPYQKKEEENGIKILCSTLEKFVHLNVLYLTFRYCSWLNDPALMDLSKLVKGKLPRLEYLTLDFEKCVNISNEGFFQFGVNILSGLTDLKGIILNLDGCERISEEGIITFLELIAKSTRNLEDLTVTIGRTNGLTIEGAHRVIQKITNDLNFLQKLTVDFRGSDLTEEVDEELAPLQVPKSIRELTLYFDYYQPKLIPLAHEDIKSLTLTFDDCNALTSDSEEFCLSILSPEYKNLQQLTLIFGNFTDTTGIYFFNTLFVENAAKFNNLKSLTIEILDGADKPVDDDLFEWITICVRDHLKNLESLSLSFNNWEILSGQSMRPLSLTIAKNLTNLKSLKLDFGGCSLILPRDMNEVLDFFAKYMKGLRELEVSFGIKQNLRIEFENHKGLRHIPIVRIY